MFNYIVLMTLVIHDICTINCKLNNICTGTCSDSCFESIAIFSQGSDTDISSMKIMGNLLHLHQQIHEKSIRKDRTQN